MPVSRMRMRPWLEQKIESNAITGLHWVDKDKTTFSIPWKHAARHGWEMDKDASLFKQWAIHTGKYVEGQNCDPKTWKANFRCAMNSLPDIEEVKDKSVNKGHQAMRVFRMLPTTAKSRDNKSRHKAVKQRRKSSAVKMEEDTDYSDTLSPINASTPEDNSSTQENTVDSTMRTEQPDFTFMAPSEVPDWSSSVEISGVDFSSSMRHRFEVSPEHSFDDDFDYTADVIKICEELERGPFGSLDDMGFLTNEACSSPGSQWSDTSSASDLDEPQYTTLVSDLTPRTDTDNLWNNFCSQLSPML